MLRSTVTVTVTAALLSLAAVSTAKAAHPCTSDYLKFREAFDKHGAKIAQGICNLTSKQDAEKAKKCLADFDAAVKKANDMIAKANKATNDGNLTIGPRQLGEGTWRTGALQNQRTWVSPPVVSDTFRVQMERTGGKADSDVTGTVCFLDADGKSVKPPVTFKVNRAAPASTRPSAASPACPPSSSSRCPSTSSTPTSTASWASAAASRRSSSTPRTSPAAAAPAASRCASATPARSPA
jgi:hypothetical protein